MACIYKQTSLKQPLKGGKNKKNFKTNNRLMQVKNIAESLEYSAVLLTCIKLPRGFKAFVLSIFKRLLKTGFTVHTCTLVISGLVYKHATSKFSRFRSEAATKKKNTQQRS